MTILVANSNRSALALATELSRRGHTILQTTNIEESIRLFESQEVHAAVIDLDFEKTEGGYDLLRHIRADEQKQLRRKLVALASTVTLNTVDDAIRAGFDACVAESVPVRATVSLLEDGYPTQA